MIIENDAFFETCVAQYRFWFAANMTSTMDEFYAGKNIFVTGGTGFMGKVLLEKMLRCLPSLEKIYVLARAKRGQLPEERLKKMFLLPVSSNDDIELITGFYLDFLE